MPLTIGDFARIGGVSTRMLRHYDALGLLRPDRVDESSGYRFYTAAQLPRLNRLVALKDVGFSLDEVEHLLDAEPEVLASELRRRRDTLAATIDREHARLASVDERLRMLGGDHRDLDFVEKRLDPVALMQTQAAVDDAGELPQVIGPMFAQLTEKLVRRGIDLRAPCYAWYETRGDRMHFGVGYLATTDEPGRGVQFEYLAAAGRALTVVHTGAINGIGVTWQRLAAEADARGLTTDGLAREVYHETPFDRPTEWVVELQLPVRP